MSKVVTINGIKVDVSSPEVTFHHVFSSAVRERIGKPADVVQARCMATAFREDGSSYPFVLAIKEMKAVSKSAVEKAQALMRADMLADVAVEFM